MDGNGRWARQRGLPRIEGHRSGVTSVRRVTEECARLGIEQITLYCLSSENWKRPAEELDFLLQLLQQYLVEERPRIMEHNIRVKWIGRREGLPEEAVRALDETVRLSSGNTGLCVCLAINYGGRAELVDAVRRIADEVRGGALDPAAIDEETISARLYTAGMPEPDLLIRTAGEMRISNFLLVADQLCGDLGDGGVLARFRRGPAPRRAAELRRPGSTVWRASRRNRR